MVLGPTEAKISEAKNRNQNRNIAASTNKRVQGLSSDGTVSRTGIHNGDVAYAITAYANDEPINGFAPEQFLNNLQKPNGWEAAGFKTSNNVAAKSALTGQALLGELMLIDIAFDTGLSGNKIDQILEFAPALLYYEYMTTEQQYAFDKHWGTIAERYAVSQIKTQHSSGVLKKKKDAEWLEIRKTIEDAAGNFDEFGSGDPLHCEREFYHENGVGTNGYKPRHELPIPQHPMKKPCNKRTDHTGNLHIDEHLLPQTELLNKYKWIPITSVLYDLYKEKSKVEAEPKETLRFSEQCFLIDNMEYMQKNPHTSAYKNFTQVAGGDPKDFLNTLIAKQNMGSFVKATPKELSGLVPYIRIWKVLYPNQNQPGRPIELRFKNNLGRNIDALMKGKYGRGDAVGIKSFEWNLAGTNAVEASRLIESRLVLYFQDINALAGEAGSDVSFLDLIYRNPKHITAEGKKGDDCGPVKIWNEKYYRMKIQVGWSTDGDLKGLDLKKTFFLTLIDHEINFRDNGTIELSLRLQSQIEGLLSSPNSDILLMDRNEELVELQNELDCFVVGVAERAKEEKKNQTKVSEKQIEKREKQRKEKIEGLKEKIKAERSENYRAFLEKVEAKSAIHFIDVPMDDLRGWNFSYVGGETPEGFEDFIKKRKIYNSGKGSSASAKFKDLAAYKKAEKLAKEQEKEFIPAVTAQYLTKGGGVGGDFEFVQGGKVRMHYVYLGSVMETALSVHNENKKVLHELRNIIGNIELKRGDKLESASQVFSLADIPVSLKQFTNWYYDECISKDKSGWNMSAFLKSLTSFIVKTVKSDCLIGSRTVVGRPRVELRPLSLPLHSNGEDRLLNTAGGVDGFNMSGKKINGVAPYREAAARRTKHNKSSKNKIYISSSKLGSYLVLSVYNTNRTGRLSKPTNNRSKRDAGWGIYHFKIGMDRGLLKNISFSKMDDPMLESARYIEEGDTLGGMVRRYNATVDMYGNNLFQPGSEIFLDTGRTNDVSSISHKLGLGGYYMVRSVNSSIKSGEFTTSLDCIFISSGREKDKEADPVKKLETTGTPTEPPKVSATPTPKKSPKKVKTSQPAATKAAAEFRAVPTEEPSVPFHLQRPEGN